MDEFVKIVLDKIRGLPWRNFKQARVIRETDSDMSALTKTIAGMQELECWTGRFHLRFAWIPGERMLSVYTKSEEKIWPEEAGREEVVKPGSWGQIAKYELTTGKRWPLPLQLYPDAFWQMYAAVDKFIQEELAPNSIKFIREMEQ